jgi:hypothetical protein
VVTLPYRHRDRKGPDDSSEADKKHALETLEFHTGNEIFAWSRIGCDRFLNFFVPHFVLDQQQSIGLVSHHFLLPGGAPILRVAAGHDRPLHLRNHVLTFQMRKVFVERGLDSITFFQSGVALLLGTVFLSIISTPRGDVSLYLDAVRLLNGSLRSLALSSYACGLAYANSPRLMNVVPRGM